MTIYRSAVISLMGIFVSLPLTELTFPGVSVVQVSQGQVPTTADAEEPSNSLDPCLALHDASLFKPMQQISTKMTQDGKRLPPDCTSEYFREQVSGNTPRATAMKPFHWQPINFFHQPVYLDNVPLELYGQTRCELIEPITSGVRFVLGTAVLPYRIGMDRPHDCVTTLGHLPPGDCAACIRQTLPWEADAAFLEAATAIGLVLVLP